MSFPWIVQNLNQKETMFLTLGLVFLCTLVSL